MPILVRASLRYLARHRWQSWLSMIGIALGVAVVIAVDIANASARRAFELSLERVTGRATHRIEAASGRIPDATYGALIRGLGLRDTSPVIEGTVRIGDSTFTLLGLDPLAFGRLRGGGVGIEGPDLTRLLSTPGTLLLGASDAARLGALPGEALGLRIDGREANATLIGILTGARGDELAGVAIADIATAQELLARIGDIDRIDLVLEPAAAAALAARLPPGLRLVESDQRRAALGQMTRAFHINLTAMSLLAMLVGGFIIYNTMTFAVLQRRALFGSLRILGCTRAQLFALVLIESLVFALLAALLGIAVGILTGWGLVQLVTRTINDLYFVLTVRELFVTPLSLLKGVAIGLLVTLIAALGPATEAARSQPQAVLRGESLERRGQGWIGWLAAGGGLLVLIGWMAALVPLRSLGFGFVALMVLILGFSLSVPALLRVLALAAAGVLGRIGGLPARLAARGVAASITRTGIAAAALTVAIATTVGVGVMIESFRSSLVVWLEGTLRSDIYVAAASSDGQRLEGRLPPTLNASLAAIEGVSEIGRARRTQVIATTGPVSLMALDPSSASLRGFEVQPGQLPNLWDGFAAGTLILASEPFIYHQRLAVGDPVRLFTTQGWRDFRIGGIFRDYGSDRGLLVMAHPHYAALWDDAAFSSFGLVLREDSDRHAVLRQVRAVTEALDTPILVSPNHEIRERSLAIFDRTFAITQVLRLLAIGVAFIGVLSALLALQLERQREHGILRATGMTRRELAILVLTQTSIIGVVSGVLAIPLGLMMGDQLIEVINLRSFGWTMEMRIPLATLGSGVLLAWLAALLAGVYPALRSARLPPAALRSE